MLNLRDPVRRFVLPRWPEDFEEAVELATQEEVSEQLVTKSEPICAITS